MFRFGLQQMKWLPFGFFRCHPILRSQLVLRSCLKMNRNVNDPAFCVIITNGERNCARAAAAAIVWLAMVLMVGGVFGTACCCAEILSDQPPHTATVTVAVIHRKASMCRSLDLK